MVHGCPRNEREASNARISRDTDGRGLWPGIRPGTSCFQAPLTGTKGFDVNPIDAFSLDPKVHGTFDTVLFLGIFDRVEDPGGALEKAASIAADHLVVSSFTRNNSMGKAVMEMDMDHHKVMLWIPSVAIIQKILSKLGFTRFDVLPSESDTPGKERHIARAWRS